MDKFVSAKMYNERLLDSVAYALTAPVTFTLENSLCAYFKCKSLQRNEYYQLGEAKSTKKEKEKAGKEKEAALTAEDTTNQSSSSSKNVVVNVTLTGYNNITYTNAN